MIVRREQPADHAAVHALHSAALRPAGVDAGVSVMEADLTDALRTDEGWLPSFSLVAENDGEVVGHVVCTQGVPTSRHDG